MATPMRISNELRVGIMFLTGLVLLVLVMITLTRWGQDRNTYSFTIRFKQAQGLLEGAAVRVAGVPVGRVTAVDFNSVTSQADVKCRVNHNVRLYENYHYTIGIGGLVGERFVEIRPVETNPGPLLYDGSSVDGTPTPDIGELFVNANQLVNKLTKTVDGLNSTMLGPENQENLRVTLANLKKTSATASDFADALNLLVKRNAQSIDLIVANLQDVSRDVREVSDSLAPQLANTDIIHNLESASARVPGIVKRFETISSSLEQMVCDPTLMNDLQETVRCFKQSCNDLTAITAQAKLASTSLPRIASNLERASADLPGITGPFRQVAPETAENIRQISLRLRAASTNIGGMVEKVSSAAHLLSAIKIKPEASITALTGNNGSSRSDANLNFVLDKSMFRAGVVGMNNTTFVNLQAGSQLNENLWLRYGMIQSHFGIGADFQPNDDQLFTGELFNPNTLQANAIANFRLKSLGSSWWINTGFYNIFHDGSFGIGITYRP